MLTVTFSKLLVGYLPTLLGRIGRVHLDLCFLLQTDIKAGCRYFRGQDFFLLAWLIRSTTSSQCIWIIVLLCLNFNQQVDGYIQPTSRWLCWRLCIILQTQVPSGDISPRAWHYHPCAWKMIQWFSVPLGPNDSIFISPDYKTFLQKIFLHPCVQFKF